MINQSLYFIINHVRDFEESANFDLMNSEFIAIYLKFQEKM